MLPKLRVILAAAIATCAAVLALSAGLVGTRDPGKNLTGVPEVSRALMREAIVEEPEWQHFQLLAYTRRADELQRLRDLTVTPARAVVEYAERAQAKASQTSAETASAPAAAPATIPPAETAITTATIAPPPAAEPAAVATAPAATPAADDPPLAVVATAPVAVSPADEPPPAPVASAPAAPTEPAADAGPPASIAAAQAQPASVVKPDPVETPVASAVTAEPAPAPAAASGGTQVANVQSGNSETAAVKAPEKPKADAKPHHGTKAAHAHDAKHKKKLHARAPARVAPAAATGFPIDPPKIPAQSRSNNTLFGSRSNTESKSR